MDERQKDLSNYRITQADDREYMVNGRRIFSNMCSLQESKTKTGFAEDVYEAG